MHLKLLQNESFKKQQKQLACDLIGNNIVNKIPNLSKKSKQSNLETVINEHDKEISEEKNVSPEEILEIIDELRLK